jgi:hypothetical protein
MAASLAPSTGARRPGPTGGLLATAGLLYSYFFITILMPDGYLQSTGSRVFALPLIGCGVLLALAAGRAVTARRVQRVLIATMVFAAIFAVYSIIATPPATFGTADGYLAHGVAFFATYSLIACYAGFLYDEELFVRWFIRVATASLVVAVAAYGAYQVSGSLFLVSHRGDTDVARIQGFLSEPSAWAPVVAATILVALRERRWWLFALACIGGLLTKSPIVMVVTAVSVAATYGMRLRVSSRRFPIVVGVSLVLGVLLGYGLAQEPESYMSSGNDVVAAFGRLSSGIRNVTSGGLEGKNLRADNMRITFDEVHSLGSSWTGVGPDAANEYFAAKYPDIDAAGHLGVRPNTIWLHALFDFGWWGAVAIVALTLVAIWRSRVYPVSAAVLLPFLVSSLINSASGVVLFAYCELAILLFAFGWIRDRLRVGEISAASVTARQVPRIPMAHGGSTLTNAQSAGRSTPAGHVSSAASGGRDGV